MILNLWRHTRKLCRVLKGNKDQNQNQPKNHFSEDNARDISIIGDETIGEKSLFEGLDSVYLLISVKLTYIDPKMKSEIRKQNCIQKFDKARDIQTQAFSD